MRKSLKSIQWLSLGRYIILGYTIILLVMALVGTILFPAYARLHVLEFLPNYAWTAQQTQAGLAYLGWPDTSVAYLELARSLFGLLVGGGAAIFLLWRRPASWFILYLAFVLTSIFGFSGSIKPLLQLLPGLMALNEIMGAVVWQFFFILFYLFPSGHPVPGWTRWTVLGWVVLIILYPFFRGPFDKSLVLQIVLYFLVFGALGSQFYRFFWRSDPIQRQQTKAIVVVLFLILALGLGTSSLLAQPLEGVDLGRALFFALLKRTFDGLSFALIPLAILLAIFRYRLWDIDLVIRRTLQYGLLTLMLGLVYFGMVVLLGQLFQGMTGQASSLVVVLSTLAIVALFNPLRLRIQNALDRRFFRQKYDGARALEAFSATASREVELNSLSGQLVSLVEKTVQPEGVWVWIRKIENRENLGKRAVP